jgi:hypothetical protein
MVQLPSCAWILCDPGVGGLTEDSWQSIISLYAYIRTYTKIFECCSVRPPAIQACRSILINIRHAFNVWDIAMKTAHDLVIAAKAMLKPGLLSFD